jgi:hypothetical protein
MARRTNNKTNAAVSETVTAHDLAVVLQVLTGRTVDVTGVDECADGQRVLDRPSGLHKPRSAGS